MRFCDKIGLSRLKASRIGGILISFGGKLGGNVVNFRARKRLHAIFHGNLTELTDALKIARSELEKSFYNTGVAVEKLALDGGAFVQKSESFVNCAAGRTSGTQSFFDAMPVIERPLNFLFDSHPRTQSILERLKQDSQRIDELINVQADLQRTIGPLKYIQTLFKIESAPLGGEVQAMFGSLTKEIETLHDQICELFTTRFLELRTLQRTLNQVIRELQNQAEDLHGSILKEKAQIEQSLTQLKSELSANQAHESHIRQVSGEISGEVQKVVVSLQYQDIINQKLQHTFESVERLEESIDSGEDSAAIGQLCRLEAKQLQVVRQELAGAEDNIRSGVKGALNHLVSTDSECLTLADFNQLTTSVGGMVQVMQGALTRLQKQMASTVASSARAHEQLRPMGGLASDLTHIVRDLSVRIHLIGLNAQIQAAQVGNGVALEALSARTSDISRATMHISEDVATKLDRLVVDLSADVKALDELRCEALLQQEALGKEGSGVEQNLHKMRDGTAALLNDISALLDGIKKLSEEILTSVNYTDTAGKAIENLETELLKMADAAGTADGKLDAGAHALIAKAQGSYTMISERKVFSEIFKGEVQPDTGDPGNSVELFDMPAAPEAACGEPVPAAVVDATQGKVTASTLGDNVELF